jgi:DNA-binding NarL/FixJ family response regulator
MEASTALLPIPARPPRATAEAFAEAVERLLGAHAHEVFVQVLEQFTERLAAEARASLAPAGASAPADDLADLSSRELDVLELVAAGLSNEDMAARLDLSVRTVERHLSNVYVKLRVSGKAGRAAAAARYSRVHQANMGRQPGR